MSALPAWLERFIGEEFDALFEGFATAGLEDAWRARLRRVLENQATMIATLREGLDATKERR